jgi:hypothetical protein
MNATNLKDITRFTLLAVGVLVAILCAGLVLQQVVPGIM